MRRIEPALPDLLPLSFQLGPAGSPSVAVPFDPVELRHPRSQSATQLRQGDRTILKKPARLLVHAEIARFEREHLDRLVENGYGLLVVLDAGLDPGELPQPLLDRQIVAAVPTAPALWGGDSTLDLAAWRQARIPAGILLGLAPAPDATAYVRDTILAGRDQGAEFAVAVPVAVTAERRHEVYDERAGETGDSALENLLFHTDLTQLTRELEREASRCCRAAAMAESLPGPGTATVPADTFAAGATLLLWARRLDLLDGVGSLGWQLRRAAHALLAAGRGLSELLDEDNIRIVPGFTPWVEAFARSAWNAGGPPFDDALERWVGR